jgi:hypothetical protein
MPAIPPKDIQLRHRDEETPDGHPEAIGESREGEGGDEDGCQGGDEDDEGFGGQEVEEEV